MKLIDVELNKYYKDIKDGAISKLIGITHRHDKYFVTIYDMLIIKEGKYPSLNKNPIMGYTPSAMKRCEKLTDAELLAVIL